MQKMTKRFSCVLFCIEHICSLVSLVDINFVCQKLGALFFLPPLSNAYCIDKKFIYHVTKHKEFDDSEST